MITIALLFGSEVNGSKIQNKIAQKASLLSEANMLAVAESMSKAKLHAKAHSKSE